MAKHQEWCRNSTTRGGHDRHEKCVQCCKWLETCACRRRACLDIAEGPPSVLVDGHDDAMLGLAEVECERRVVYDRGPIIPGMMRRDSMDKNEAAEFFNYNIEGN